MINKNNDWFKIKRYLHIDFPLECKDRERIKIYIQDKDKISTHAFLPFIHKKIETRKFRKEYDPDCNLINGGKRKADVKVRDLYYASHFDSNIYSFYSHILSEKYENKLIENNLSEVVTAYRKIPLDKTQKIRNKCNIDFANEIFEFINEINLDDVVVISLDIKGFFDNLDHKLIKKSWCDILQINNDELPEDHYNVFRNITKFSYVNQSEIFNLFKDEIIFKDNSINLKNNSSKVNKIPIKKKKISNIKYLRNKKALAFCEKKDIKKLLKAGYIKSNKRIESEEKSNYILRTYGIPQGSPISSILANIYLFNFDLKIDQEIKKNNGIYRRYSDDIVIVCKPEEKDCILSLIKKEISYCKLEFQENKTQIFTFKKDINRIFQCTYHTKTGKLVETRKFTYLGFEFDGKNIFLKSSSLSKFYRTLKRTLKRGVFYSKHTNFKNSNGEIFKRRLYKRFSYEGSERKRIFKRDKINKKIWIETNKYDWGNYLTYTNLANRVFKNSKIKSQIRNHWKILNKLIKDNEII